MTTTTSSPQTTPVDLAAKLRSFGPLGTLVFLAILAGSLLGPLVAAPLVILWVVVSKTTWRDIGYVREKNWWVTMGVAVSGGVAFKLLLKAVVMPLLGADPINRAYHYLAHNPAALPGMLFAILVGAAWGEETFWRGYLFERLGKLLGATAVTKAAIVIITSALFGLAHYPVQGLDGVVQAVINGAVLGTVFIFTKRLFPLMVAHASFDLAALAIIYWDVEAKVAHTFFR